MLSLDRMALAMFLFGATACGSDFESSTEAADGRPSGSIRWGRCGGIECGSVPVPIDYDDPGTGTIPIAVNRVRADANVSYLGVIFLNPGGPGGPGKPFVAGSAAALRTLFPGFDFIGFDPRGVGDSAPLPCVLDVDPEQVFLRDGAEGLTSAVRAEHDRCAAQAGALLDHLGSNQVVRDIEQVRAALGVEQLNFFGVSYGTRLGALYAQSYPEHLRALVLDAPFAPRADLAEETEQQFTALLDAQAGFFADCDAGVLSCPEDAEGIFDALVESARSMGVGFAVLSTWKLALASEPGRKQLALLLTNILSESQGQMPTQAAMPQNFIPVINAAANYTTNCADDIQAPPTSAEGEALMASCKERSDVFGTQCVSALLCAGWQVARDPVPAFDFTPQVPALVVGGVEDSLTPLEWAEETTQLIGGSSFLASEHYGHGAIVNGGRCVFDYLRKYLTDLEPVPADARCAAPPP